MTAPMAAATEIPLVAENVACQACERADGIWDVRHVFNANAAYELPFGPGKRSLNQPGFWHAIAGSWEMTSMAVARTGFPEMFSWTVRLRRAGRQYDGSAS